MMNAAWGLAVAVAGLATWAQPAAATVTGMPPAESQLAATPPFRLSKPGEDGCPPASGPNVQPVFPRKLLKRGVEGAVILHTVIDRCGFIREASIWKSSRYRELDQSALEAVRQWRFTELEDVSLRPGPDGLIRGPMAVQFENEYADPGGYVEPAAQHAAWCDSLVPSLPPYDEKAPRYIADPVPLAGTVDSVVRGIPSSATYRPLATAEETYELQRGRVHEIYRVATPGSPTYPAVIRQRYVHDDKRALWVVSFLCEAGTAACAPVKAFVEREGTQWVHTWPEEYRERGYTCPAPTASPPH